ncbi:MAG: Ig-like domain-containing protein [Polyangiaceae bacterium]
MTFVELPRLVVDRARLDVATSRLVSANRDPAPGELGVPVDSTIALELIDTGTDGVARGATRAWVDGALAFQGGAPTEFASAFSGVRARVTQSSDTLRIVLDPAVPLASLATISVRVSSQTVGGAASLDEVFSFTVEDRTAPRVVAAHATDPVTVRVAFDEAVVVTAAARIDFRALGTPAVPVTTASTSVDGSVVVIRLNTELTPDVQYEVTAVGVTDRFGNVVLPPFDRARFTGFRPGRPPNRRFDLWSMLPKHNRRDDQTGDLQRFIACLQEVTDLLLADIDRWADIFDYERAPERFLDLILHDLGNPFPFELDELGKRRLASVLVQMYQQKGTAKGIQNAIRFFLGIDGTVISEFASDALTLGESELGVDWILGPSDRFARYAFNVEVPRLLAMTERRQLRQLVEYLKPAHTHFVDLVEPVPPAVLDHWELGLSEVGVETALH